MVAKLIVTGLGEGIRDEDIYDLFDVYGLIVDVGVNPRPKDEVTGYVVYEDNVCALRARLGMDGAEVNGRRIGVRPVCPDAGLDLRPGSLGEDIRTQRWFLRWK